MRTTTKTKPHSPKRIVDILNKIPPIQAETLMKKHYIGIQIQVSGTIENIDVNFLSKYITLNFLDKDNVQIAANFNKPINKYVSAFKKGDNVSLKGNIFNIGKNIVVLDNCRISPIHMKKKKGIVRNNITKKSKDLKEWYQKPLGIIFLAIIGGVLIVLATNTLGLTQWPNKSEGSDISEDLILPAENYETQSPTDSITPKKIKDAINSVPPLQKGTAASNYKGIKVSWSVYLGSGSTSLSDKNLYTIFMSDEDRNSIITCDIDLNSYPQLKVIRDDQAFIVEGEIYEVDSLSIDLVNCKLLF